MLNSTISHLATTTALAALAVAGIAPAPVAAQAPSGGSVVCLEPAPSGDPSGCVLSARTHQDDGGRLRVALAAGGGGHLTMCPRPPEPIHDSSPGPAQVPCNGGITLGWYSHTYDCYFNADNRAARAKDPNDPDVLYLGGTEPGDDGAVHLAHCYGEHYNLDGGWRGSDFRFLPPRTAAATPDPTAQMIADALDDLALYPPAIGTGPPAREGSIGLVGLPVWLWNETNDRNWGTRTGEANTGGITATATATAEQIIWNMGDGTEITCEQGTAYHPDLNWRDPPCGHRYDRASRNQPDGRYPVTATTTWHVQWEVTGPNARTGTLTLHPSATVTLEIRELQVLVS